MPDWTLGLAILVRIEPWLDLSASEAEGTALKIISILKKTSSGVPKLSSADVIATVVIRDKYEAHRVTRLLLDLSQRAKIKTSYELGLIRALESWMASTAYRVISPNDLKALRGELEYTQEAMAGALKVTLRHYSRYEAGMAGVPKKKRTAINRLRRRASKGHSTTAASPKMRAQRPALKLKS